MSACRLCRGRGHFDRWSLELDEGDYIEPDAVEAVLAKIDGERVDVVPPGVSYWVAGERIEYQIGEADVLGRIPNLERAPCLECQRRRDACADKREAKNDRRRDRADNLATQANADQERSQQMLPWGREIVGE